MEMLVAVDLVAAEDHSSHLTTTTTVIEGNGHRRWRDPAFAAVVAGLVCLVLLSLGYWRQTDQAASLHRQTQSIQQLQQQNHQLLSEIESCTTPKGKCSQRGAKGSQALVDQIVNRMIKAMCTITYFDDPTAVSRCIVHAAATGVTGRH